MGGRSLHPRTALESTRSPLIVTDESHTVDGSSRTARLRTFRREIGVWVLVIAAIVLVIVFVLLHDGHGIDLRAKEFSAALNARDARRS